MSTPSSSSLSGPIKTYLDSIQKTFSTGMALEHAYRPALVALLGAPNRDSPRRADHDWLSAFSIHSNGHRAYGTRGGAGLDLVKLVLVREGVNDSCRRPRAPPRIPLAPTVRSCEEIGGGGGTVPGRTTASG